ncbi:peptidase C14, caspase domain-containing protein [Zopfochytrium polystomum]|nr:peptidase C14, caspase domain-containing protein [Zopfochytrium polystomum]
MLTWLTYTYPFPPENILVLTEDQPDPSKHPTRDVILHGLAWLVEDAQDGDPGTGSAVKDVSGDEIDGMDETIVPLDYEENGQILDDVGHFNIAVAPLPRGSRLTAIFDCCHSGSIMDLQFSYDEYGGFEIFRNGPTGPEFDGRYRAAQFLRNIAHKARMGGELAFHRMAELVATYRRAHAKNAVAKSLRKRSTEGTVIQFSACRDWQKSVDVRTAEGDALGVMSWAILQILSRNQHPTLKELFIQARALVEANYDQCVTLSTGRIMNISQEVFTLI